MSTPPLLNAFEHFFFAEDDVGLLRLYCRLARAASPDCEVIAVDRVIRADRKGACLRQVINPFDYEPVQYEERNITWAELSGWVAVVDGSIANQPGFVLLSNLFVVGAICVTASGDDHLNDRTIELGGAHAKLGKPVGYGDFMAAVLAADRNRRAKQSS